MKKPQVTENINCAKLRLSALTQAGNKGCFWRKTVDQGNGIYFGTCTSFKRCSSVCWAETLGTFLLKLWALSKCMDGHQGKQTCAKLWVYNSVFVNNLFCCSWIFVLLFGKHCQATFVVKWGHCKLFSGGKSATDFEREEKCGLFINELRE